VLVSGLNSPGTEERLTVTADGPLAVFDWKPSLRADGCELFFSSDRPGGIGARNLYRVELLR
jgi:hypothetical protein